LALPPAKATQLNGRVGSVQFGLRPEHISAGVRVQGDSVPVQGVLRFTEHMGSEVFVHFNLGELALSARVPADQLQGLDAKKRGDAHEFHVQLSRCHLFDAESGISLLK
jgi:oligogalacturonide transport system ATP-binding protein